MAAADASAAVAASSPALPPDADHSPSNVSSPLTEVEDKDGDPDEMELDGPALDEEDDDEAGSRAAAQSHSGSDNEDESALSEVEPDVNDSEAETERLYNTPPKGGKNIKDTSATAESSPESATSPTKRLAQTRDRTFQASPSKLKQQLQANSDAGEELGEEDDDGVDGDEEENGALSDAEDEANNEADGEEEAATDSRETTRSSRRARSLATKEQAEKAQRGRSPSTATASKTKGDLGDKEETPVPPPALLRSQRSNSDARKRKRSPTTDPSESDQPLRKRLGHNSSGGAGAGAGHNSASAAGAISEELDGIDGSDGNLSPVKRPNGAGDDEAAETPGPDDGSNAKADADENSAEGTNSDTFRTRRSRRGSAKTRKTGDDADADVDGDDEINDEQQLQHEDGLDEGEVATAEEDAAGAGEDEPLDGDIDEEAEAAHRNEEELERKKAALDNLHLIEKQFASFRDKLYQERLDQLNQEEAMLTGDNPTHPEYLAMMQCIDERRDEKIRVIDLEYEYNTQALKRWAVARRSHIHGQYFQSVRESRELVLEELGRQWYQIQQQRRRHAITIPDYGLRFPASQTQRIKDAITYNKEVSILSGVAKYEGFPAAPQIRGASSTQVVDDLEAIARGRQVVPAQPVVQAPSQSVNGDGVPEYIAANSAAVGANVNGNSGNGVAIHSLGAAEAGAHNVGVYANGHGHSNGGATKQPVPWAGIFSVGGITKIPAAQASAPTATATTASTAAVGGR